MLMLMMIYNNYNDKMSVMQHIPLLWSRYLCRNRGKSLSIWKHLKTCLSIVVKAILEVSQAYIYLSSQPCWPLILTRNTFSQTIEFLFFSNFSAATFTFQALSPYTLVWPQAGLRYSRNIALELFRVFWTELHFEWHLKTCEVLKTWCRLMK